MQRNGSQASGGRRAGPRAGRDAGFRLDAFLPYLVNVLAHRLSTDLGALYRARFGITIPEWRVIAHVASNRRVSVREIHERVAMDKTKVSRAAASLEAAGIVRKDVNAADRRLVSLELTPKGRRLHAAIAALAVEFEHDRLAALTPQDRKAFARIVRRLLDGGPATRPQPRRAL